ncbi:MAG: protein kinase domain-containing protein [Wenzhouxiangella sp.]
MSTERAPEISGYRVEQELGRGGMATVYLAVQESLERCVALKVMKAALAADEEFAERFVREARTAASLQHSSIVAIFDAGQAGHHFYIAMEYVSGGELKDRLRHGAMNASDAVAVIRQIAAGLNYAHGKGFVHRDVKPENILFREDGTAVLSDFGIARAIGSGTRMTATGLSIGTPHYMSPEQARGQAVDGRSDLYALGVLFFEMLSGEVPFDAQDSFALAYQHINDPIPQLRPMLGKYQPIINRLLAKDSEDRYQSGAELIEDLDRIEQGEKLKEGRAGTRVMKSAGRGARRKEQGSRKADHGKVLDQGSGITDHGEDRVGGSRTGLYWGLGGAALAAVLAVGIYFWQDQRRSPPPIGGSTTTVSRPVPQPIEALDLESAPPETGTRQPEPAPTGAAILHITTVPEGAEVFLGNHRLGQTPFQSDDLPEGEHRLRLVHPYYEPWEQTVRLEDDVVERIEANLQRGSGRVTVITDPPGAEIWIGGRPMGGTTPLTLSDLRSGDQSLDIRLPRYRTETHQVEILPGETARLDITLEGGDLHEWEGRWLTGDEVIPYLLEAAEADLAATRLRRPDGENAYERFSKVLEIHPSHKQAEHGLTRVAERYVELAESALSNNDLNRARELLDNAAQIDRAESARTIVEQRLHRAKTEALSYARRKQVIFEIQMELQRLGHLDYASGSLDYATNYALQEFHERMGLEFSDEITEGLLAKLRKLQSWPSSEQRTFRND